MNVNSIMKNQKHTRNLTVTYVIKTFNMLLNTTKGERLSSLCTCILRMYNPCIYNILCPIHIIDNKDCMIENLLENFKEKNFLYITLIHYHKIIYNERIKFFLPLVLYLYIKENKYYFINRNTVLKLNNPLLRYTNMLIINFITLGKIRKIHISYNQLLCKDKVLKFKYAIFINSLNRNIQNYIEKDNIDDCFKLKLKEFLENTN